MDSIIITEQEREGESYLACLHACVCVCMFLCVERVREGVCVQKLLRGITLNCLYVCEKREWSTVAQRNNN